MTAIPVAALQLGSSPAGTAATLERILVQEATIAASGARLVVMPEALLGGYPKGETFDTYLGYRLPAGRERYAAYHAAAIERDGATLYCSALFIDPEAGLVAVHRKLMPTASERLVWGQGDGSTLAVVDTAAGRAGAAICWENHMPLLRMAMYAKGVQIWCAPTVDEREIWQCSMRHIAHEGRCFVISAAQYQPSPAELGIDCPPGWSPERPLMRGGSLIVGPLGEVLAGPLYGQEGLVSAIIDTDSLVGARYDLDVAGHYARPDVFRLEVDERPRPPVAFRD